MLSRSAGFDQSADETRISRCLLSTCSCSLPPLGLGVWVVRRATLAGSSDCPLVDFRGPAWGGQGGQVTVSEDRATIESVSDRIEVGWVHGERAGTRRRRRRRRRSLFEVVHARDAIPNEMGRPSRSGGSSHPANRQKEPGLRGGVGCSPQIFLFFVFSLSKNDQI